MPTTPTSEGKTPPAVPTATDPVSPKLKAVIAAAIVLVGTLVALCGKDGAQTPPPPAAVTDAATAAG